MIADRGQGAAGDRGAGDARPTSSTPDPSTSHSLELGVAILQSVAFGRTLGIFEIADIVGRSRATTHRYAITLVALGYLEQDSNHKYRLSARAADSGMAVLDAIRRELSAWQVLEALRDEVGYTVSVGVLDRTRVTYVYRLFGHRPGQYAIDQDLRAGANVPVYCTALGKALSASLSIVERGELLRGLDLVPYGPRSITTMSELVAELDRVGERDIVVSDEEFLSGARSIAVRVPHLSSKHSIGIEVTAPSKARTIGRLVREVGPPLKRAAGLIAGE
jgi:IclR family pca regulon transcriptional regulator